MHTLHVTHTSREACCHNVLYLQDDLVVNVDFSRRHNLAHGSNVIGVISKKEACLSSNFEIVVVQ